MKQKLTIVKVGGKIIESEENLKQLIEKFSLINSAKVLVHGGGRSATKMATRLGVETTMVEGRRVTDKAMLDVVTMVYGGLVNKQLVSLLQSYGVNAMGLTGSDGDVIRSHRREVESVDYGFVGDVDTVNVLLLSQLLYANLVPVLAPLTHDGRGNLLNTNADTIASSAAVALSEVYDVTLCYCFEFDGVLKDATDSSSVIHKITKDSYQRLREHNVVSGGMIPKLDNAFDALEKGVNEVVITSIDGVGNPQRGTHITIE